MNTKWQYDDSEMDEIGKLMHENWARGLRPAVHTKLFSRYIERTERDETSFANVGWELDIKTGQMGVHVHLSGVFSVDEIERIATQVKAIRDAVRDSAESEATK